jgi:hypothetical protein
MIDIATSLTAAMNRAIDSIVDDVAQDGLEALKIVLDSSGFSKSEYLKNYQIFAHVIGRIITFEIILDIEAILPEDLVTTQALQNQTQSIQDVAKTYGMSISGPQRLIGMSDARRDARQPARDARQPARDARKNSRDRLIAKEVANIRPRSARISKSGRLSVALRRSVRENESTVIFPEGVFQGILGKFLTDLKQVIVNTFAPKLAQILGDYGIE